MSLEGKRIALLAEQDFEDSELIEPLNTMRNAGASVVIVGSGTSERYRGKRGTATINVDAIAAEAKSDDFDAVHREVDRCLRQAAPGGGYMLSSCNSIFPGMHPDAVREMYRYAAEIGEYKGE